LPTEAESEIIMRFTTYPHLYMIFVLCASEVQRLLSML
jgi:hypothetical protein